MHRTAGPLGPTPTWGLAALAVLLAAGCTSKHPTESLFPLEPGHRWTYSQVKDLEDGRNESATLVMVTLPTESYEGSTAFRRQSTDGVDYWLRRDETGVYRVASKYIFDEEPRKDPAPRYVLKEPLVKGTEWLTPASSYVLVRSQGYQLEIRHDEAAPIQMRYVIEALGEKISTAAGDFEGCLRVQGKGSVRLYTDGSTGWKDMPLISTEWYCPGPGLVKLTREEPAQSAFLTGGKLTLELQEWERP